MIKNNTGAALIIVMLVMFVLSIFGIALLSTSVAENRFVVEEEKIQQAHYIAYSAANAFARYIEVNPDGKSVSNPGGISDIKVFMNTIIAEGGTASDTVAGIGTNGAGSYVLTLEQNDSHKYTVKTKGIYGASTKSISLILEELAYFDTAIFAFNNIDISNNSTADGNGAPFVAGGTITGHNNYEYIGDIYDSTPSTPDPTPFISAMDKVLENPDFQFPEVSNFLPNADLDIPFVLGTDAIDLGGVDLQGSKGVYFGEYQSSNQGLTFINNSSDNMYVLFDSIDINNADINVTSPNARTFLYIQGPDVGSGGSTGSLIINGDINVSNDTPIGNLVIFAGPNVDELRYRTGNSLYSAIIFAPYSDVFITQGTSGYAGSIISYNTTFENGADFKYPDGFNGLFGEDIELPTLGFETTGWNQ